MFNSKTVFVVGAGASCDFNLPTGDKLRNKLTKLFYRDGSNLRFTHELFNRAIMRLASEQGGNNWPGPFTRFADASDRIKSGLPLALSIDNFLDAHRNDETMRIVGKIAIATVILSEEESSPLRGQYGPTTLGVDRIMPTNDKIDASWYLPLMRLLTSGKSVDDLQSLFENVAFIVFNYDRCLEQFLVNAIINYYNVPDDVAVKCMQSLTIIHPYGQVGPLRWQDPETGLSFGQMGDRLIEISQSLQTFTESTNSGVVDQVRQLVRSANTLVFMGFGFLPQNMDLLAPGSKTVIQQVFATTKGISDSDVPIVVEQIGRVVSKTQRTGTNSFVDERRLYDAHIERSDCRALLDNNWLRLTTLRARNVG